MPLSGAGASTGWADVVQALGALEGRQNAFRTEVAALREKVREQATRQEAEAGAERAKFEHELTGLHLSQRVAAMQFERQRYALDLRARGAAKQVRRAQTVALGLKARAARERAARERSEVALSGALSSLHAHEAESRKLQKRVAELECQSSRALLESSCERDAASRDRNVSRMQSALLDEAAAVLRFHVRADADERGALRRAPRA